MNTYKPEIENKFKQLSKVEMAVGAFSTLGITGIFIGMPLLALTGIGSSMLMTGYFNYKNMVNDNPLSILNAYTTKYYKKTFEKWFNNYLSESDNTTEQKYKLIMVKLWLDQKYLTFKDVADPKNVILDNVLEKLLQSNATNMSMRNFLLNSKTDIQPMDFIVEDLKFQEKIDVAKSVYKQFQNIGLLGKNIDCWMSGAFPIAAYLQDYKINDYDISYIKLGMQKKVERSKKLKKQVDIQFYGDNGDIFDKLLDNNSPEILLLLKDFFATVTNINNMPKILTKENIIQTIDKKAQYVALYEKVEQIVPTTIKKVERRNKI